MSHGTPSGRSRPAQRPALLLLLSAALALCLAAPRARAQERQKVFLIRLSGMIHEAHKEAIQRKIEEALNKGAELIILELDTPGGTLEASQALGDYIFRDVETRIVAYINTKAYSGGTMVALACDEIYMDEAVGMMGDVAPITASGEEVGEKVQSPIRTSMMNYARDRYPTALVEAMVTKEIKVYRIHMTDDPKGHWTYVKGSQLEIMPEKELAKIDDKELVVDSGRLLTISAREAEEYGFARKAVSSRLALYDELGVEQDDVTRLYLTTTDRLLNLLDMISPLLIIGGLILLSIEIRQPGFGLPGILGLGALATFFAVKYSLHYAHLFEILLFVAGISLLAVEVLLIPGFGIVGALGIALLFASVVLMLQQFQWPSTPSEAFAFHFNIMEATGTFLGAAIGLFLIIRFMGFIPVLNRLIRRDTMAGATVAIEFRHGEKPLADMVGEQGLSATPLRPAGRVQFGERIVDVVTEGEFLEKGTRVEVVAVRGANVVVRPGHEH